jgi:hypothetical protein
MKTTTAKDVAVWLMDRPNVTAARPVIVQIKDRIWQAARYTKSHNDRLYCLGNMPPLHDRMRLTCYRTDDSEYAWHLIAWYRQNAGSTEWQEVHPFGSHVILALRSPVENWATDQCAGRPYRRIPMTITAVDGPADPGSPQRRQDAEEPPRTEQRP